MTNRILHSLLTTLPLAATATIALGMSANTYEAPLAGSNQVPTIDTRPHNDGQDIPLPEGCDKRNRLVRDLAVVPSHYHFDHSFRMTFDAVEAINTDSNDSNDMTVIGFCED